MKNENVQFVQGRYGVVPEGDAWRIAEIVTSQGKWITHPEAYGTRDAAAKAARAKYNIEIEILRKEQARLDREAQDWIDEAQTKENFLRS